MRKRFDEETRDLGVTSPQWRVLLLVSRCPGINQSTLAETIEVEPISICRMVDRLEQAGLVERRKDPRDRRVWQLYLTDTATPLIDKLESRFDDVAALALSGLKQGERDQLYRMLETIRQNLAEAATGQETGLETQNG